MTTPNPIPPLQDTGPLETMARGIAKAKGFEICSDASYQHSSLGALAKAAINALTEAGYAIVPTEPTEPMVEAGNATDMIDVPDCDPPVELPDTWAIYRAMISAAQGDGA